MRWPTVPLGEIAVIRSGGTPSRSQPAYYGGSIPWAKISDLDVPTGVITTTEESITYEGLNAIRGRLFPAGTLLFAIYGSIGKMAFAGRAISTNQAIIGIELSNSSQFDPRFLYRWLAANQTRFDADGQGIAQKNLSAAYLRELRIAAPPLDEQRRIAAILDQADALRRKRRDAGEQLSRLNDAVFRDMFGDPSRDTSRWPTASFDDACADETSRSGKLQRKDYRSGGAYPVVDQGQSEIAGWSDDGDLLCRSEPPVVVFGDHTRAVKYVDFPFIIGADGAKVLKPSPRYHPVFFAHLLERLPIPDLGYSRHMREVKRLAFPAPPRELQDAFAEHVGAIRVEANRHARHLARLDALFASLQQRAFAGELTAATAERELADA